ncbi:MAG: polysaccharide biosynthesis protein [Hydrogenothermaceae bacterium]|nr:polysaccharide biosynthesis protein [Hydrogenothermaceae bacterium]
MEIKDLLKPTKTKRFLFFIISDTIIFFISFYLSFLFRFEFNFPTNYSDIFHFWVVSFVVSKIFIFYLLGIYNLNWRFIGLKDFFKINVGLITFSYVVFLINIYLQSHQQEISIPKSIIIIDFFVSLFLVSLIRISKRVFTEIFYTNKHQAKRTLIIGAGTTGERILRGLLKDENYYPVCFVDDDPLKIGTRIHGVPVVDTIKNMSEIIKENRVEKVIIAIPSLSHRKIREIFDKLMEIGVKDIHIVPSLSKLPKEHISIKDLKEISIEDLLSREEVKIDKQKVREFIQNKVILVTGAGGSIGSEIVRQLIDFEPKKIVALEIDETELHNLSLELKDKINDKVTEVVFIVADIREKAKLENIFSKHKPNVVFHAAAYKHVPLMEFFPEEAVKTNIFGTYNVAIASINSGVEKFINISTDKAVNPTSVMGATKRFAEIMCTSLNSLGKTKFISVRFGNVLGSRGSVIPIFIEQIKKGGPITITHPEMKRYFMTIPEAVLLVFQAAAMGEGGEVFVLDMGEPVKIVNLAEELIKLQGLKPYKDIDIVFTGLRPGEKLFEELLTAEEGTQKTFHEKIFIAKISKNLSLEELNIILNSLLEILNSDPSPEEIKQFLKKIVPFYEEKNF